MTQNEWLAIAPFLMVSGLALLVIIAYTLFLRWVLRGGIPDIPE